MRIQVLLLLAFVVSPFTVTAMGKDEAGKLKPEKRGLLSNHDTLAVFDGVNYPAAAEKEVEDTAKVTGTFIVPKDLASFEGRVVEIRLYKIHPMLADKPADLVEMLEIKDFAHTKGTETKREFVIGAKAKLEKEMKYYLTLFILKDGERTHMGEVSGKFLCTVLTQGNPNTVTLKIKQVR